MVQKIGRFENPFFMILEYKSGIYMKKYIIFSSYF
jgi:hypothetical protein